MRYPSLALLITLTSGPTAFQGLFEVFHFFFQAHCYTNPVGNAKGRELAHDYTQAKQTRKCEGPEFHREPIA